MQYELKMKENEDEQNRRILFLKLQDKLSNTLIFNRLNMTKATMYKRRNRIKERIGLESESDMEDWVGQYLK